MNLIKIKEPMSFKNDAKICLGIDFGTTNSVCSVKVKDKFQFIIDEKGEEVISEIHDKDFKSKNDQNEDVENQSDNDDEDKKSSEVELEDI